MIKNKLILKYTYYLESFRDFYLKKPNLKKVYFTIIRIDLRN